MLSLTGDKRGGALNVVMITENDPAGMGIAFCKAINRHTSHKCRLITTKTKYNFNFEKDLHVPDLTAADFEQICDLLKAADIIHFHILSDENIELGPIKVKDFAAGKVFLHHHHGHPHFREQPEIYGVKYRRLKRRVLVSTPDLLRLLPEATWQPNLVPINDPLFRYEAPPVNGAVIIGQAVTRKDLKDTEGLEEVIGKIRRRSSRVNIDVDIIENTDHRQCLRRKRNCHLIFDHMQGYYGVSSLESLSQGRAVIAGLDEWNVSHIKTFAETSQIPWIVCRSGEALEETITSLSNDRSRLMEIGVESRGFMCRHWSDRKVSQHLIRFYESL